MTTWLNARDLYRDLAIPEQYIPFSSWIESRIENDFEEGDGWHVKQEGQVIKKEDAMKNDKPASFWITQAVADQIAKDDAGPPVEQMRHYTRTAEFSKINWNQQLSEQTHAITGDEDG